jgi:hypothetical protein
VRGEIGLNGINTISPVAHVMKFAFESRLPWRIVFLVAVIAGGALSVAYTGGLFGSCKTVVLDTIPSPDGSRSIVIFRKQCAAAVPYSTQASVAPAGVAFSAERIPAFFIVAGTPAISVNWLANNKVEMAVTPAVARSSEASKASETSRSHTNSRGWWADERGVILPGRPRSGHTLDLVAGREHTLQQRRILDIFLDIT